MKIRSGFISNSSSSSFIMVGIEVSTQFMKSKFTEEQIEEFYDGIEDLSFHYNNYSDGGGYLIGKVLADADDFLPDGVIDFNCMDGVYEKILKYIPDIKKEDVKIYYGTRSC